jgi:hypothetical protein
MNNLILNSSYRSLEVVHTEGLLWLVCHLIGVNLLARKYTLSYVLSFQFFTGPREYLPKKAYENSLMMAF